MGIGADGKVSIPTPSVSQPVKENQSGRALATLTPGALSLDNQTQDLSGLNTDLGKANTTVSPYDIDRLKAKQESAAALSELLNGLTGDISNQLGFKEGSPEKIALHTAVGAIVAKLAGGDIAAGAVAGAASEIANGVLQEVLKANPNLSDDDRKAITQWVAVVVGAAAGGATGAATGLDNVNFNYLDHAEVLALKEATDKCHDGDQEACSQAANLNAIDSARDDYLHQVCSADGDGDACQAAVADLRQVLGSLYGNNQNLDVVALHWVELYQRSMGADLADPSGGKRDMLALVAGAMLGGGGAAKAVTSIEGASAKAVSQAETGIVWGKGIQSQGLPWEDYLEKSLSGGSRLPPNFKTFDFYDEATRHAISADIAPWA